jgi:hypothetical protein
MPAKRRPRRGFVPLPPGFENIPDCTVDEAAAYRRESRWTVFKKLREGKYRSYLDGKVRKVIVASLREDRERQMNAAPTRKRSLGRPKGAAKPKPEDARALPRAQPQTRGQFEMRPIASAPAEAAAAPPPAQPQRKRRPPREGAAR